MWSFDKTPDRESIKDLAWFMGVDLDAIEEDMDRRRRLSAIAWEEKPDARWETSQAFHRYVEVLRYRGRQVFWNDWFDQYTVFGLPEGMRDARDLGEAIALVRADDNGIPGQ